VRLREKKHEFADRPIDTLEEADKLANSNGQSAGFLFPLVESRWHFVTSFFAAT
jgi:hypothetical protein